MEALRNTKPILTYKQCNKKFAELHGSFVQWLLSGTGHTNSILNILSLSFSPLLQTYLLRQVVQYFAIKRPKRTELRTVYIFKLSNIVLEIVFEFLFLFSAKCNNVKNWPFKNVYFKKAVN